MKSIRAHGGVKVEQWGSLFKEIFGIDNTTIMGVGPEDQKEEEIVFIFTFDRKRVAEYLSFKLTMTELLWRADHEEPFEKVEKIDMKMLAGFFEEECKDEIDGGYYLAVPGVCLDMNIYNAIEKNGDLFAYASHMSEVTKVPLIVSLNEVKEILFNNREWDEARISMPISDRVSSERISKNLETAIIRISQHFQGTFNSARATSLEQEITGGLSAKIEIKPPYGMEEDAQKPSAVRDIIIKNRREILERMSILDTDVYPRVGVMGEMLDLSKIKAGRIIGFRKGGEDSPGIR